MKVEQQRSPRYGPLHDGRINGFCLVSLDSDFTSLATGLRREGAKVYGFDEKKTPGGFERACDRISLEKLLPQKTELKPVAVPSPISPHSKILKPPRRSDP
ncbi:NYN domain-containing protein [Nitrobacter vulgaris]|uniref:NYN domain-containing protein n=1 Tax=Nitrobacter vulgaris TaxID=29421 RepID=UPI001FCD32A5|nr:NYN domain-containing protein [Nitrobacter vulgaris]